MPHYVPGTNIRASDQMHTLEGLYKINPDPAYIEQLIQLLPHLRPRSQANLLMNLARYDLQKLQLKSSVELWAEQNKRALGFEDAPQITINLSKMSDQEIDQLVEGADSTVLRQLANASESQEVVVNEDPVEVQESPGNSATVELVPGLRIGPAAGFIDDDTIASLILSPEWHERATGEVLEDGDFTAQCWTEVNDKQLIVALREDEEVFKLDMFAKMFRWLRYNSPLKTVCILSDPVEDRASSVALLWLAKKGKISRDNYESAKVDFHKLCESFAPSSNLSNFMRTSWKQLLDL